MTDLTSQNPSMGWLAAASPIAGAAVGAVGDVAGGLFSANQARKNRKFQERMYNKQVEDNRKNWEMVNEYNHPSAVLARMREAGLNPLLMYQGGQSLTSQSTPQGGTPGQGAMASAHNGTNFGQAFYQAALMRAQIRNMEADSDNKEAQANQANQAAQSIGEDVILKRATQQINQAIRYRDYDFLNQSIAESQNRIFQSSFVNANEMASLALGNNVMIERLHLDKYQVGENIKIAWENVKNGRIQANASLKSAFAALMQATTAASIAPYQIGVMRETAFKLHQEGRTEDELRFYKKGLMRKELSWYDILRESGVSEQQSRTFLNTIDSEYRWQQNEWMPFDKMMTPFNALVGFGAGMYLGTGNPGRKVVKGFGR